MATFFEVDVQGSGGVTARARWRVTDVPVPIDLGPAAQSVVDATFGSTKLCQALVTASRIIITDIVTPPVVAIPQVVTNKWQTRNSGDAEDDFRLSLPGANPDNALIATGSKVLANLADARWVAYKAAIIAASFAYEDPDSGTIAALVSALKVERSRVRPRVGSGT